MDRGEDRAIDYAPIPQIEFVGPLRERSWPRLTPSSARGDVLEGSLRSFAACCLFAAPVSTMAVDPKGKKGYLWCIVGFLLCFISYGVSGVLLLFGRRFMELAAWTQA